ncbi:MAG: hypothetical protein MAG715_01347 [Methanonatronarchaeales archaeon]|nr:hypothetical protein [Methanonatronarchaeales archaeon]
MHPRGRRSALAAIVLTVVALQAASAADVSTFVSVDLEEDGDAHWTVQVRVPLESEAEVEAFREIGGSEAGPSSSGATWSASSRAPPKRRGETRL